MEREDIVWEDDPEDLPEPRRLEQRICPDCHGTAVSPYPEDGGSCPHCFNGLIR